MPKKFSPLCVLLAAVASGVISGCSGMQPTPTMPSQPARIGGPYGETSQQDAYCRQQAYQAAEKTKQDNMAKEVGSTAVGSIAGAVIGNALEPDRYWGRGRRYWRRSDPHYGTAGAVTGAAVGAAASQTMVQNTQQVYDITYNNCMASYAR
jgi:uncharacterized protein YcfJ